MRSYVKRTLLFWAEIHLQSQRKKRRASRNVAIAVLSMALDRSKVSDRNVVLALTETSRGLGKDVGEMNINRSSFIKAHKALCTDC